MLITLYQKLFLEKLILHYRTMWWFQYIYPYWMCVQSSFYRQLWINTWRSKFEQKDRQYSSCLLILWTKVSRILMILTWMYHVMHNTCTMHGRDIKTQFSGSTSILLSRKDCSFYQTRSNAIILYDTLPAYCIPKVVWLKTGEVLYEKVYMSPRPPPKISLKHEWKRELGSEVARQPEGQVVQQSRSFRCLLLIRLMRKTALEYVLLMKRYVQRWRWKTS